MTNPFFNRDIISIKDFSRPELEYLFSIADKVNSLDYERKKELGKGKILGLLFFEPSTRTRLSFEAAMLSIGGDVLGFAHPSMSSVEKGENLADTMRTVESYVDAIVLRHPMEGASRFATEVISKPVINAGSGTEEHPTQAMIDLYTIMKVKGRIDGLNIAIFGDLKYGRTVYSLIYGLSKYSLRIFLVSPPQLKVKKEALFGIDDKIKVSEHKDIKEIIGELDVIYVTRIQKERFPDPHEYEKVKGSYIIDSELLKSGKEECIVMHPLPKVGEIAPEVDNTPNAKYFLQVYLGKVLRSGILVSVLNPDPYALIDS
ncbi:MAG: aspartate carbamoyltransferase [archaeon]|nr:aspartate carbamoyltransferase [archaeon]MCP8306477.1 aspartate carbamoyltransferase [archaeon]